MSALDHSDLLADLAHLLVGGDFSGLRHLLAEDCRLELSSAHHRGRDDVVAAFVARAGWLQHRCDDVRTEGSIESANAGTARLVLTEYLIRVPGRCHRHVRRLDVHVNVEGRLDRIVERGSPADEAALARFVGDPAPSA